jgi:alanine racemase
VLRWSSSLIHVRRVPRGTSIGYGWLWTARRDAMLGLVPVGYADGYPTLRDGSPDDSGAATRWVRIVAGDREAEAPVVGTVNMDQLCVDLTGLEHVLAGLPNGGLGAEVELYGSDRTARNYLPTIARRTGLRPYELLCRLSARIPRVAIEASGPIARVEQAAPRMARRASPDLP